MAEKLTNITAAQYRCTFGACPAVYKSEDGKTFTIIGELTNFQNHPEIAERTDTEKGEAAVEIPADLLLSSLGVAELVEAAKLALNALSAEAIGTHNPENQEWYESVCKAGAALRSALSKINGGGNG